MKILRLVCLAMALISASVAGSAEPERSREPIVLKPGPHLLIDEYLIEKSTGVERKVVQPQRFLDEPIVTGRPEHQNWQPFLTVIHYPDAPSEKRFRIWYNVDVVDDPGDGQYAGLTAHMESADGVHWPGPYRRLESLNFDGNARFGACVIDEGPQFAKPDERFKMMFNDVGKFAGPRVATSPDGLQWKVQNGGQAILKVTPSDDIWSAFYDPIRKHYALIGKAYTGYTWTNAEGRKQMKGLRLYYTSFSDDFKTWGERSRYVFAPDEKDTGITQWYGAAGFQVRGDLIFGFLRVLHDERTPKGAPQEAIDANTKGHAGLGHSAFGEEGGSGMGYTVLAWTRDGQTWERDRYTDPYFEPDPRVGSWDHAMAWIGTSTPVGDELYMYYAGYRWGHKYHHSIDRQFGLVKAKRDRFVARRTTPQGGKLTTRVVKLGGDKLVLNTDAGGGEVRVQVTDPQGRPVPGFTFDDCQPVKTDSLDAAVQWKKSLSSLRDKLVRLEFLMSNASLFAFQFE